MLLHLEIIWTDICVDSGAGRTKGILPFYFKHFVLDTFKQSTNYWVLYSTEFSQSKHSFLCKPVSRRTVLRITSIYRLPIMYMTFAYYVARSCNPQNNPVSQMLSFLSYTHRTKTDRSCITHPGPPGRGQKWDPSQGVSGSWACMLSSTHFIFFP